ncbi:MAG TPA: ATP-binding protein [Dehalococcoidia bacterium]|jgi:predicted ATPase|nr:ATP-binding protein [Dehalococcoidia bacterium]
MLTRLQVRGFKNLVDVDVRFGPFTCVAGPNGVGKSNLFDAILFLSELADKPFVEAARNVRGGDRPEDLFSAHGDKRMSIAAEMVIRGSGEDEFRQRAEASATFVRYELELSLRPSSEGRLKQRFRLEREDLSYISKSEAKRSIAFPHKQEWRESVVRPSSRRTPFISTDLEKGIVNLHADRMQFSEKSRRGGGKPAAYPAETLPRTALSSAQNAEETRTAVLVRKEMRNWRLLQLEPSAMREPDDFQSEDWMTVTGAHIPATLYRIASSLADAEHEGRIYATTANRLAELVEGVRTIRVDRDDTRQALSLMMTDRYGLELPASALSDGTMRFIALTVLQQDPSETGVICLEEPENGIHPERIEAMLRLLNDIAVDVESPVSDENPLRQIIINTHSPIVARLVGDGDLLFASVRSRRVDRRRVPELGLACLDSTWRSESGMETIPIGKVMAYLQGVTDTEGEDETSQLRRRRVMDRFHPGQLDIAFP